MKRTNAQNWNRRHFLKGLMTAAGGFMAVPTLIPSSALGRDGAIAPSERIVLGAIGIGGRGSYVLGCFLHEPDVQFVAIAEVKA
ncbi:MAG: twin-arginine translocation signal domain-containing protein, partial [Verrucomicrobia bacterium]|nr:twin-arginine translocation signal domain-containing protein [Verrucomicrobiota bacterium]